MALVADALSALGVEHMVCGSLASSKHGEPRSTYDIDVVADLGEDHVTEFVRQLRGEFYVEESMIRDALARRIAFNVVHLATGLKIDVFPVRDRAFSRMELSRAAREDLDDDLILPMASAEDTLLAKLEWFRKAGEVSERQWRDVMGIVKQQRDRLDLPYCRLWASELGVEDLLDRVLDEAAFDES